ncbi:MAG TPA: gamma-glutamyltransferase family protein [Pararobbsia sp.]|nr:gamma-glutamyltransferase family protein [Pararobbsia sp.]
MLDTFSHHSPYSSRRSVVYSLGGMVATSQPVAAQIGRDMLARGGNAIDAAIATAAALTVVEPTSCSIGGDAFAIVWIRDPLTGKGTLHGLNASGPAPAGLSLEQIRSAGHTTMPMHGWMPVTVPGCPSAWAALSRRFGKLPFKSLLAPAIALARDGFAVTPVISQLWQKADTLFRTDDMLRKVAGDDVARRWFDVFTPKGRAPRAGEVHRWEAQARTLEELADTECESFYRGTLARAIDAFARESGGYLRESDLASYQPQWVDPISVDYRGYQVWEIPPNGQGLVALLALNILKGFDDLHSREHASTLHRQLEAMKLAFADGQHYITETDRMKVPVDALLSEAYAARRRALIGERASDPLHGDPVAGGTVYLAAADRDGNMISFIQSHYRDFGSAMIVPGTGIVLQNRGAGFNLEPDHHNVFAPGKRPYHTIIPGFLTRDGEALGPFGVMGAFMQPQGHVQVLMNLIDFGLNPQAALDAPRWQWFGKRRFGFEQGYANALVHEMAARGHDVYVDHHSTDYGRGQIILRNPATGVYCGGTEPRTDGVVAAL